MGSMISERRFISLGDVGEIGVTERDVGERCSAGDVIEVVEMKL